MHGMTSTLTRGKSAVHINGSTIHDEPTLPHGGMKSSGYGRFGSSWGISEFLTTQTITFKVGI